VWNPRRRGTLRAFCSEIFSAKKGGNIRGSESKARWGLRNPRLSCTPNEALSLVVCYVLRLLRTLFRWFLSFRSSRSTRRIILVYISPQRLGLSNKRGWVFIRAMVRKDVYSPKRVLKFCLELSNRKRARRAGEDHLSILIPSISLCSFSAAIST
jgi:hypothetical protein